MRKLAAFYFVVDSHQSPVVSLIQKLSLLFDSLGSEDCEVFESVMREKIRKILHFHCAVCVYVANVVSVRLPFGTFGWQPQASAMAQSVFMPSTLQKLEKLQV